MTTATVYLLILAAAITVVGLHPRVTGSDVWRRATWGERREWRQAWSDEEGAGWSGAEVRMLDTDARRCCALKDGHDGCCAYFCSGCSGDGRTCFPDDLGCSCGFCDGYGYCGDCGGSGWFNEDGIPCMAPRPDELPEVPA